MRAGNPVAHAPSIVLRHRQPPSRDDVILNQTETAGLPAELKRTISILVVDDDHSLRVSCTSVLEGEGYDVSECGRGREAMALLQRRRFDIVLLDLNLGQVSGMDVLKVCLDAYPDTLVIIMTGNPSVQSSIDAERLGAWNYLPKPFSATHLQVLLARAGHACTVARESRAITAGMANGNGHAGHSGRVALLGDSAAFRQVVQLARKVSGTDASVFLSGESGTGKEQIAQYIHANSRRSSRQLVAVNCAALPEGLLESEMFGHVQGAFTGAVREKEGLLETAHGGTLFLDEITDMPAVLQAKLLRVIQDGVVRRLGSNATDAVVNVRFIAATNHDMSGGSDEILRSDLFYRLCVVPIRIPPLRERPEDIPLLADHFLAHFWAHHREPGEARPVLGAAAIVALQQRTWSGNVRELQNVIEHAVVLLEPGCEIRPDDLPDMTTRSRAPADVRVPALPVGDETYHGARERVLGHFESRYLRAVVGRAGGNMSKAARLAGVDRTTLYRLMDKHNLQRDAIITAR
jgi:DNA-binding NtrC family response regulator